MIVVVVDSYLSHKLTMWSWTSHFVSVLGTPFSSAKLEIILRDNLQDCCRDTCDHVSELVQAY